MDINEPGKFIHFCLDIGSDGASCFICANEKVDFDTAKILISEYKKTKEDN
jgi:hypothetical protein